MANVLLAGGGTAGHVNPLLATADTLLVQFPDAKITVLGTATGLESQLVPDRGYPLEFVPRVPMPRTLSVDLLKLPIRMIAAVRSAHAVIRKVCPDVVVGFGGYVSTPAYLAARLARVPIVVHEQNARPGLANVVGARLTRHVATTFAATRLPRANRVGMPLRSSIVDLARATDRAERASAARARLGLNPAATTLIVTGGSSGAQHLNEVIAASAAEILATGAQVLHLTGAGKADAVRAATADLGPAYQVREYLDEMELAYAAADLVVCRAGAVTVCELSALGIPAIYVPLPIGNGEQQLNASATVAAGGGLLIDNAELETEWLPTALPLLRDRDRLAAMGEAAAGTGLSGGAENLVAVIAEAGQWL